MILGRMLERSVQQALTMSGGDLTIFIQKPISAGLLLVAAFILLFPGRPLALEPPPISGSGRHFANIAGIVPKPSQRRSPKAMAMKTGTYVIHPIPLCIVEDFPRASLHWLLPVPLEEKVRDGHFVWFLEGPRENYLVNAGAPLRGLPPGTSRPPTSRPWTRV